MDIFEYIDHSILSPSQGVGSLYQAASRPWADYLGSVCVKPHYVRAAREAFRRKYIRVSTVLSFPLGNTEVALVEAKKAIRDGASELDMATNVAAFKETGDLLHVEDVYTYAKKRGVLLKVILETCQLTEEQINLACHICEEIGVAFTKTSTGFSDYGATIKAVEIMTKYDPWVKASGGIKTLQQVKGFIDLGATRIGTSATEDIYQEMINES